MSAVVYRMYDDSGCLLYVGLSSRGPVRLDEHGSKPWWADLATVSIQHFSSVAAAATAELAAIREEHPVHNRRGRGRSNHCRRAFKVTSAPPAFKAWREERRWSQKEAAAVATKVARDRTGSQEARVSPSTIAMIETGERQPSVEVLEWLAEAYGVPTGALAMVKPMPAEAVA